MDSGLSPLSFCDWCDLSEKVASRRAADGIAPPVRRIHDETADTSVALNIMNKQLLLIRDAYDFGPLPPKPREMLWEKLYRFFFGDDVFISYARSDALRYVPTLAARLAAKKHICFFDQLVADPNKDLPERLKKKILRSTVFVLVGTRGAVASSFVRKEIELFRSTRRPFIPVDVDGALIEQEGWRDVIGVAKIPEQGARVRDGDPSPEVVNLIKDSFRYTRRSKWLRASLLAGVSIIFITAVVSLLVIRAARGEAVAIKRQAELDVAAANKEVGEARQSLHNLTAEADRAKAAANAAVNQAESAVAAAEVATTQQKAAEQSLQRAQALERQTAERAAETARREAGSRAALLSREPGMEGDALALAIKAAEQSGARRSDFPDEVMNGITSAANAADYSLPLEDLKMQGVSFSLISPNGEKILGTFLDSRTASTRLLLWDGRTGKRISEVSTAGEVVKSSFSRDGNRLATVVITRTQWKKLVVWDLTGPRPQPLETLCGINPNYTHLLSDVYVALDSDGSHAIISEPQINPPSLTVCEIATGRKELLPQLRFIWSVAFTPEDEPALYGRDEDPGTGGPPDELYFPRSGREVTSKLFAAQPGADFVGFGDDSSFIMIARNELAFGQDRVYVQSPDGDVRRLGGYRGRVSSAAFVDGQARVVTVSGRIMRIADARSSPNFTALRAHVRSIDLAGFSPDNRMVLTIGDDGKGRLWDLQTGRLRHTLAITDELLYEGPELFNRPKRAAFRADGKRLVTVNEKGEIQTWDLETGHPICPVPGQSTGTTYSITGIAFLAGGDYVMVAYRSIKETSFINYLDARTCKLEGTFKFNEPDVSVLFSRDGTAMLTGTYTITSIWDRPKMEWWSLRGVESQGWVPTRLPSPSKDSAPGYPHGLSFASPLTFDATRVLGVQGDDFGQIWVLGGNSPVRLERRRGDMSGPFRVVLSADGTRVAAVSWKEARVWDARSGKLLLVFECDLEVDLKYTVSLSPDGSKLLIAGKDNTVRIYPTSREDFLRAARLLLGR